MNELGLGVNDFVNVYGHLLFESVRGYLAGLKRGNQASNIKVSKYLKFEEVDTQSASKVIVENEEVNSFILNNLNSSTGLVVAFEKRLGNLAYKQDGRVWYNSLRVTAGDIVLAIGASREADREIVRVRNDIVAVYQSRLAKLEAGRRIGSAGSIMRASIVSRNQRRYRGDV
ncbi:MULTISPECIES: hypothetical protein [unclassified Borrelia]|uniref:hypothetical protein n=1 Tax=unclassified Borrelia TaxID=2649934 RepID=UPI001E4BFF51|nr:MULTISPECIES: hypothetical protein [unclassified Borrelia]UGQ16679.1 hypothetical protein LSO06_05010 [Borrelia sp. RT5S]UGQ17837.1 hypothetical protein LSO05_05245 [Borrelia sp. RT1S]